MSNLKKSLKSRCEEINQGCPIMLNREKMDLDKIIGDIVTITDFDYMMDRKNNREYVVFVTAEYPDNFVFGGQVLSEKIKQLDSEGYGDTIRDEGLPVRFGKTKAKDSKTMYTTVEFYPEGEEKEEIKSSGKKSK